MVFTWTASRAGPSMTDASISSSAARSAGRSGEGNCRTWSKTLPIPASRMSSGDPVTASEVLNCITCGVSTFVAKESRCRWRMCHMVRRPPGSATFRWGCSMSREQLHGLMNDALKASDADQTEIVIMTSNSALTWYAENIIHQNVADHTAQVQVRAAHGKKVGSASTTDCSPEGLALVVQQASHAARLMPDDPGFPGLPSPQPIAEG